MLAPYKIKFSLLTTEDAQKNVLLLHIVYNMTEQNLENCVFGFRYHTHESYLYATFGKNCSIVFLKKKNIYYFTDKLIDVLMLFSFPLQMDETL